MTIKETELAKLVRDNTDPEEVLRQEKAHELDEDEEFLYNAIVNVLASLKGSSKEEFRNNLNQLKWQRCFMILKYHVSDVFLDGTLAEATEEKINNLLGHKGLIVSYNESIGKWQCILNLRGGLIIFTDETQAICGLRAAIYKYTAANSYYYPTDLEEAFVKYWQEANASKENPLAYTREDAERAANEIGTTVDEIEAKIAMMNKKQKDVTEH